MDSRRILVNCTAILTIFLLPLALYAGETTLTPSLAIGVSYDDNIRFDRTDPIDDYSSIIRPALKIEHQTEKTDLKLNSDVRFINYLDQTDFDTVKQGHHFSANRHMTERLRMGAKLSYIRDTLLDSELEETGRVFNQEDRERYAAGLDAKYSLSQKSEIGVNYNLSRTDYESQDRIDRDTHSIRASYGRFFNEGLDSLRVIPQYSYILTEDDTKINNYSLKLGWSHKSSEIGTISLFVGGRYTERTYKDDSEVYDSYGMVADLNYAIEGDIYYFKIGYNRDIFYDADNDLREVDKVYTNYHYSLTERTRAGVSASFYLTRSEDSGGDNKDTRFLNIYPFLAYSLTERHSLRLNYRYSLEYDDTLEYNKTKDRSQISLVVVFNFPYKY